MRHCSPVQGENPNVSGPLSALYLHTRIQTEMADWLNFSNLNECVKHV